MINDVGDKKSEVEEVQSDVDQLQAEVDELLKAKEEYELSNLELNQAIREIPASIDQDDVILELIENAEQNQIEFSSLSFSRSGSELEGVSSLVVSSSFQGTYNDLINFLDSLENGRRVYVVDSINVSINKLNITGVEVANFSLNIKTYFLES